MNEQAWLWLEALGHWLLAWTVVVSVVSSCLVLTKVRRPGIRYAGWLLATFSGAVLLPVVIGLTPVFSWREMTGYTGEMPTFSAEFPDDAPAPEKDEIGATPPATGTTQPVRDNAPRGHFSWLQLVFAIWMGGAALFTIRLVRAGRRVRRLLAESEAPASQELISEFQAVREQLGVVRHVRLATSPWIVVPMCGGFMHPTLLWPAAESHQMSPSLCRAVLAHELTHLQRYDDWVRLVAELWRILCWFFIPIHGTYSRLRREQEFLSDEAAALTLDRPETYAQLLLDHTSVRLPSLVLSSSFAGGCPMTSRVRHILRDQLRRRPLSRKQGALLAVLSVLLLVAAGSLRLVGFVRVAEASAANETSAVTNVGPGAQTGRQVDSDVGPDKENVPNTTDWKVLFSDDFEQGEMGVAWKSGCGSWVIEDGHLKGQLAFSHKTRHGGAVKNAAVIYLMQPILPETVEVRYETWYPEPLSSEGHMVNDAQERGIIMAMLGVHHPGINRKGLFVFNIVPGPTGAVFDLLGWRPDIVFAPKDRHHVRLVRESGRVFVFVDDELVTGDVGEKTPRQKTEGFPPLKLRLSGQWGKPGMVVYFDNVEIRTPATAGSLP